MEECDFGRKEIKRLFDENMRLIKELDKERENTNQTLVNIYDENKRLRDMNDKLVARNLELVYILKEKKNENNN